MLSPTSLQDELAAARREGLATDPESLQVAPVPDERNGAGPYIRAVTHSRNIIERTTWKSDINAIVRPKYEPRRISTLTKSERKRVRFRERVEARHVAYVRALFRRLPRDPLDFRAAETTVDALEDEFSTEPFVTSLITMMRVGVGENFVDLLAANESRRQVVRAAADVLDAWSRTGHPPASLPRPYTDPFGGALRYRRDAKSVVIYSIGPDRTDDRGTPETRGVKTWDIVWRLPIPATISKAGR